MLALKMEDGTVTQGMWVASGRQGNDFSTKVSRKEQSSPNTVISAQGDPYQTSKTWKWKIIVLFLATKIVVIRDSSNRNQGSRVWSMTSQGPGRQ